MIASASTARNASAHQRIYLSLLKAWHRCVPESLIRRALEEAHQTAENTGFPNLFFPELAAERVRAVRRAVAPPHSSCAD